jgi:hypothetical protein
MVNKRYFFNKNSEYGNQAKEEKKQQRKSRTMAATEARKK